VIGTLALIGFPFFAGYYSKDLIIDAVKHQHHLQADNAIVTYAYWCVMIGVFVTSFYSFRLLFMTFHGEPRFDVTGAHEHAHAHAHDEHAHDPHAQTHPLPHGAHDDHAHASHDDHAHGHHGGPPRESPWVVIGPLVALAIPSVIIGAMTFQPLLFGGGFGDSIFLTEHNREVLQEIGHSVGNWWQFGVHAIANPVFYLMLAGFLSAWALYIKWPHLPGVIDSKLKPLRTVLENKYYFDWFNENVIARGSRLLGTIFWKAGDTAIIDRTIIDGSAGFIGWFAGVARRVQSGFLYSYAFWMVIGLAVMLGWFLAKF